MQYIHKKDAQPPGWDDWFADANGERAFAYRTPLPAAKQYLINEQNDLCAYCQKAISIDNSSVEHVIPNSTNQPFSTSYHNLVAVCTNFTRDAQNRLHCDKERGNYLLPSIIFQRDFSCPEGVNYGYFSCGQDGVIEAKVVKNTNKIDWNIHLQIVAYIAILNLNHSSLKGKRKDIIDSWLESLNGRPARQQRDFWRSKYRDILDKPEQPFRQFLLIYLAGKI
ncbi:MAG: hypothetical protein H7257_06855 [Taibaiella sp.]|nr:hypothetical protein [Taibaiella sp.]